MNETANIAVDVEDIAQLLHESDTLTNFSNVEEVLFIFTSLISDIVEFLYECDAIKLYSKRVAKIGSHSHGCRGLKAVSGPCIYAA